MIITKMIVESRRFPYMDEATLVKIPLTPHQKACRTPVDLSLLPSFLFNSDIDNILEIFL